MGVGDLVVARRRLGHVGADGDLAGGGKVDVRHPHHDELGAGELARRRGAQEALRAGERQAALEDVEDVRLGHVGQVGRFGGHRFAPWWVWDGERW